MLSHVHYARGVFRATVAAGPAFLLSYALVTLASTSHPIQVEPATWLLPLLALPATVVGAVLALVPNLIGATLLPELGTGNAGLRLPVAWALVGSTVAGGAAAWCEADGSTVAAFALTGAACALLCRSGTVWHY